MKYGRMPRRRAAGDFSPLFKMRRGLIGLQLPVLDIRDGWVSVAKAPNVAWPAIVRGFRKDQALP
jgi:hypothetical protein